MDSPPVYFPPVIRLVDVAVTITVNVSRVEQDTYLADDPTTWSQADVLLALSTGLAVVQTVGERVRP